MTNDDIIRMAREAGLFTHKEVQPELLAFANLIAAAEREACAAMFDDRNVWDEEVGERIELLAFAKLAVAAEREACAAMFDDHNVWDEEVGERIRARGTT